MANAEQKNTRFTNISETMDEDIEEVLKTLDNLPENLKDLSAGERYAYIIDSSVDKINKDTRIPQGEDLTKTYRGEESRGNQIVSRLKSNLKNEKLPDSFSAKDYFDFISKREGANVSLENYAEAYQDIVDNTVKNKVFEKSGFNKEEYIDNVIKQQRKINPNFEKISLNSEYQGFLDAYNERVELPKKEAEEKAKKEAEEKAKKEAEEKARIKAEREEIERKKTERENAKTERIKETEEKIEALQKEGKENKWSKEKTSNKIKEELDNAYTKTRKAYFPEDEKLTEEEKAALSDQVKDRSKGFREKSGNQLGETDDPANGLMSKYDEALERRRQAVENKDEKAYSEASEEMHKIANSYEDETGYNFVQERQWRKRGTTSRYGKTPGGLAKYAALNPNSTEAKILENIANGENGLSYEKLSGLEGKYSSTIKTLERYGFNKDSVESASKVFGDLKARDLKGTGLTTKDIAKTELGTESEAHSVISALRDKQVKLKEGLADAAGNAELVGKLKQEEDNLTKGINSSIDKFNERFGDYAAYTDKLDKNASYDDEIQSLNKLKQKYGISEIAEKSANKAETSAGFRKRMNEKLGYGRGGNIGWGKVAKAGVAAALVAGTVGLMMGSDKGQQTNGQLYGQQPIY